MLSLDEYLRDAEQAHGHLCAGQVLGVRLAMLGLQRLGIDDPRGKDRKRLVTFVEIDRCATDAVAVVTGCRLGKRALKFRDWGKVAATFVDVNSGKAIRIAAKESSKATGSPDASRNRRQEPAADAGLPRNLRRRSLHHAVGESRLAARRISGLQRRASRLRQSAAKASTSAEKFTSDGKILCRSCAGECYYHASQAVNPKLDLSDLSSPCHPEQSEGPVLLPQRHLQGLRPSKDPRSAQDDKPVDSICDR